MFFQASKAENKSGEALLQLILVNKSNSVSFFPALLAACLLPALVCGFAMGVF